MHGARQCDAVANNVRAVEFDRPDMCGCDLRATLAIYQLKSADRAALSGIGSQYDSRRKTRSRTILETVKLALVRLCSSSNCVSEFSNIQKVRIGTNSREQWSDLVKTQANNTIKIVF